MAMRTRDYVSAAKELRSVTDEYRGFMGRWVVMACRWYQENDFDELRVPPGRYYLADPIPLLMRGGRFAIINEGEVIYYLCGAHCFMEANGDQSAPSMIDINKMTCEV